MNAGEIPGDIIQKVTACNQELQAIVEELNKQQQAHPAPDTLYHYTDGPGLLGILQGGKIRMTDIFGLNDPSELRHGVQYACTLLKEVTADGHPAPRKVAEQFSDTMKTYLEQLAYIYVACFSCSGDDLGQWRAYGADGRGFALGFRGPPLEKIFAAQQPNSTTIEIRYEDPVLRDVTERMARVVVPVLALPVGRGLSDAVIRRFLTDISTGFSLELLRAALLFKHEAYKNEQEYRFLRVVGRDQPQDQQQVRARETSLIRFIEFDWKTDGKALLQDIVIGPAASWDEAKQFVESCLESAGCGRDSVRIVRSTIPYRH